MGDFNIQTSTEWSYQMLVNNTTPSVRFNDPIQISGVWSGNPDMAPYHTQSTRAQSNDCIAGGGMDDRFDFILISNAVLDGSDNVQYIDGSYYALGQDGERFNQSINSPINNTVPANIVNALFNMSDHLPVILDLKLDRNPLSLNPQYSESNPELKIKNPFSHTIEIFFQQPLSSSNLLVYIFDLKGSKCASVEYNSFSGNKIEMDASLLPKGIYMLCMYSNGKRLWSEKLLKQ
ncbi:MAG: T9SS type A sorting domain-containing protein [Bacteroidales bacterium]|nr:T9SS type A sorting domain-containing protein [Bacteroidales bacterium]